MQICITPCLYTYVCFCVPVWIHDSSLTVHEESTLCTCVLICCWELGRGGWAFKGLGIFSFQGLCVELFSICYWQVKGWAEASAGKQTGGSSHSLTADQFLFLSDSLSLVLFSDCSSLADTSLPSSCHPSSCCFLHFLLAAMSVAVCSYLLQSISFFHSSSSALSQLLVLCLTDSRKCPKGGFQAFSLLLFWLSGYNKWLALNEAYREYPAHSI